VQQVPKVALALLDLRVLLELQVPRDLKGHQALQELLGPQVPQALEELLALQDHKDLLALPD
jgi:hypothetical protein